MYESKRFRVDRDPDGVIYITQDDDDLNVVVLMNRGEVEELIAALQRAIARP